MNLHNCPKYLKLGPLIVYLHHSIPDDVVDIEIEQDGLLGVI